eukprot:m.31141 g.31141  ORF g.31141 m.31141 type:complete len:376 (-) comp16404_c1_seq1:200-1327(-)
MQFNIMSNNGWIFVSWMFALMWLGYLNMSGGGSAENTRGLNVMRGVELSSKASITANRPVAPGVQPTGPSVGFWMHVYDRPPAVIHQARTLKKFFPDSPITIMSDGGDRFDGLCQEIDCTFSLCPPANDRWNPLPFIHRLKTAAENMKTDYVIMLEPDNTVHGPLNHEMKYAAGGMRDSNPHFKPGLIKYVEEHVRKTIPDFEWMYHGSGLAGGSYFKTSAILDAFSDEHVASINWTHMMYLDNKRVFSSDFALPIALAMKGYSYAPWEDSICLGMPDQPKVEKFAFEHYLRNHEGGKPEYLRTIDTWEDEKLYGSSIGMFNAKSKNQTFHHQMRCQLCWNVTEYYETYGTYKCANPNPVHVYTNEEKERWFKHR